MNSEDYVTRNELQAAERLARTESLIDSVLIVQKQNDRMIRYGTGTMFTMMFVVVAAFVGAGYQSIEVGKDIASLQTGVSSLQTNVSSLQTDVSSLREEFSAEIAGLRSEISSLKNNGAVVHN
jgi:outer membrane murein-binding lipoprotein Lpp